VPQAREEQLIPKGSRRSKIGLISWSELLNPKASRPPKAIKPPTAVEARVEAEGPTEELEAGGNLPPPSRPSRTSKSSAPLKRPRAEVLKDQLPRDIRGIQEERERTWQRATITLQTHSNILSGHRIYHHPSTIWSFPNRE
jgi:hypothetical protein